MLKNASKGQGLLWLLLCIGGITAVTRADNYWSHRKSKVVGFRPAFVNNQTQWQRKNQTQYPQPGSIAGFTGLQTPKSGQMAANQTRSLWPKPQASNIASQPSHRQPGNFNQTHPSWQPPYPYPNGQPRPSQGNYSHPSIGSFNQTFPPRPQQVASNYPQYPPTGKYGTSNQTSPIWSQPSAPALPKYPTQPIGSSSRTSSTNQTNIYPKLSNSNLPLVPSANGSQNWYSGSQAALSYGPGQYSSPDGNSQKMPVPVHNGSSNPYANIFN